ncbi:MAG: hypothetical protein CME26_14685 [Gemmatimonadetes bacterium]|nr:hypothetical protein [Gemmatimonadota bacterium]|tara:strand:- start:1061 stop:1444 length:384 start_codon:yes stop_codon:yes gene_type:complete
MREKKVGAYAAYVLEHEDVVVVMGEVGEHANLLSKAGFRLQESGEYLGKGSDLYGLGPQAYFTLFSGRDTGSPRLEAQVADGERFYQVDALPLVTGEGKTGRIEEIYALDLETRTFITEGISKFRVG